MRTGLNFLQTLVGLTTITVLVACGDDGGGTGGGGGGDTGTGATTTTTSSSPTTTVTGSTGASPVGPGPSSSSTGGSDCTANVFEDPDVNACGQANCCDEMLACEADNFANCVDFDTNTIDPDSSAGGPLIDCMEQSDCFGPVTTFCGGTIGYGEDAPPEVIEFLECFNDGCCEAWAVCDDNGNDPDGCLACLRGEITDADGNPDYSRCLPAHLCANETCEEGLLFFPYCESGIGSGGTPEVPQCISDNCCAEYNACTGGPYTDEQLASDEFTDEIQACLDCLNEGGGALCDAALACEEANCNTQICDSGLVIDNIELSACLSDACCTEFTACTGGDPEDEAAVQACIDCFNAYDPEGNDPPGALCADAIACEEANCAGGEGGGGGGTTTGTGGAGGAGGAGG